MLLISISFSPFISVKSCHAFEIKFIVKVYIMSQNSPIFCLIFFKFKYMKILILQCRVVWALIHAYSHMSTTNVSYGTVPSPQNFTHADQLLLPHQLLINNKLISFLQAQLFQISESILYVILKIWCLHLVIPPSNMNHFLNIFFFFFTKYYYPLCGCAICLSIQGLEMPWLPLIFGNY